MEEKATLKSIRGQMTQAETAKRLSERLDRTVRQKDISRWEHGVREPTAETIKALALIYGASADTIIEAILEQKKRSMDVNVDAKQKKE